MHSALSTICDHRRARLSPPLSLHDALPILLLRSVFHQTDPQRARRAVERSHQNRLANSPGQRPETRHRMVDPARQQDRKSTRLNSSHANISYAVFSLKKKMLQTLSTAIDES